jgi:hypothetical protein
MKSFAFSLLVWLIAPAPSFAAMPAVVPSDATESATCVAALGDVYWNPKKLPFGPTYGVYHGRLIFEEFMISQADFAAGKNWENIPAPSTSVPVNHVDVWFAPHGHDGFPQPHYDVILFFVPHDEHMNICNPSGQVPSFVLH